MRTGTIIRLTVRLPAKPASQAFLSTSIGRFRSSDMCLAPCRRVLCPPPQDPHLATYVQSSTLWVHLMHFGQMERSKTYSHLSSMSMSANFLQSWGQCTLLQLPTHIYFNLIFWELSHLISFLSDRSHLRDSARDRNTDKRLGWPKMHIMTVIKTKVPHPHPPPYPISNLSMLYHNDGQQWEA